MVDDVRLIGAKFGGNFPEWATEETLSAMSKDVRELLVGLVKPNSSSPAQKNQKQLHQTQMSHADILKKKRDALAVKDQKANQVNAKDLRGMVNAFEQMRTSLSGNVSSFTGIISGYQAFTDSLIDLSDIFKSAGLVPTALYGVVLAADLTADVLKYMTENARKLYDTGITFQNGLQELVLSAGDAGMQLDSFSDLMIKNGTLVKALNGPTGMGLLLKSTQELAKGSSYYGMSLQEINDYTLEYMEIARRDGLLSRMSDRERSVAANDYLQELTLLSQVMGKSRSQIAADAKKLLTDPSFAAWQTEQPQKVAEEARKTLLQVTGIMGEEAATYFQESFINPIGQFTGIGKTLFTSNSDLFRQTQQYVQDVKEGRFKSEQEQQEALAKIALGFRDIHGESLHILQRLSRMQDSELQPAATAILAMSQGLKGVNLDKLHEAMQAQDELTSRTTKLSAAWERFTSAIAAFGGTKFLDFLTDAIVSVLEFSTKVLGAAEEIATKLPKIIPSIDLFMINLNSSIDDIMTQISRGLEDFWVGMQQYLNALLYKVSGSLLGKSPEEIAAENKKLESVRNEEDFQKKQNEVFIERAMNQDEVNKDKKQTLMLAEVERQKQQSLHPNDPKYAMSPYDSRARNQTAIAGNIVMPSTAPNVNTIINSTAKAIDTTNQDASNAANEKMVKTMQDVSDKLGQNNDLMLKSLDIAEQQVNVLNKTRRTISNHNIVGG